MADLAVTAASVLRSSNGNSAFGTAGATITQGQVLYIDTADSNKLKLADSDAASPAYVVAGISECAASAGQPVVYRTFDTAFVTGFTALAGDTIWLSDTAGGMTKTFADLEALDHITVLGVMVSTTAMNFRPLAGGTIA